MAESAVAAAQAPTLFVVGGEDTEVLELDEAAYRRLACEKELTVVPARAPLRGARRTRSGEAAGQWFATHLR